MTTRSAGTRVEFGALRRWLDQRRELTAASSAPLAALLAHYGLHKIADRHEAALRLALVEYLDAASSRRPDDFDPLFDAVDTALDAIQRRRGDFWVIAPDFALTLEPGFGSTQGRGLTAGNLLLMFGAAIVRTDTGSEAEALRVLLPVLHSLGYPTPRHVHTAAPGVSRTRKRVIALISSAIEGPEWDGARCRAAYSAQASKLNDGHLVWVPRPLRSER